MDVFKFKCFSLVNMCYDTMVRVLLDTHIRDIGPLTKAVKEISYYERQSNNIFMETNISNFKEYKYTEKCIILICFFYFIAKNNDTI